MKEAIGGSWLMQIVIFFVLLFAAFLCFAINYTRAFKVKDELIKAIQRNQPNCKNTDGKLCDDTTGAINDILSETGYTTLGQCKEGETSYDRTAGISGNNTSSFCVQAIPIGNDSDNKNYQYKIRVFYGFDLPIIGSLLKFNMTGTTKTIFIEGGVS